MKTQNYFKKIAVIIGLALGTFALSALADNVSFSPAPSSPPNCDSSINGCNLPINTSGNPQLKTGLLTVGAFQYFPAGGQSVADNMVLTSSGGNGTAVWSPAQTTAGLTVQSGAGVATCPTQAEETATYCGTDEAFVNVTFSPAFHNPPNVIVAPRQISKYASGNNGTDFIAVRADNITATGFKMYCSGSPVNYDGFAPGKCSWMAVGY